MERMTKIYITIAIIILMALIIFLPKIQAEPLSRIDLISSNNLIVGEFNSVLFNTYDQKDKNWDLDNINISFSDDINQTYFVTKTGTGEYRLEVKFNETDLKFLTIYFLVSRDNVELSTHKEFVILNQGDVLTDQLTLFAKIDRSLFSWMDEYPLLMKNRYYVTGGIIIIGIFIICLLFRRKDERGNWRFDFSKRN